MAVESAEQNVLIPEDFAGMVHAGHTKTDAEYAFMDEMGISWTLTTFYWGSIERRQGEWDFSGTDAFVDAAKAHGKKIIGVLAYDVRWIHPEGETKRYITQEQLPHFLEFVEKTVSRYKGRVDAWQIWNEPNYRVFWKGSLDDYLAMAKAGSELIRATDPDAKLLMGGFNLLGYGKYLNGLFTSGAMQYGGEASFHPYYLNPNGSARVYDALIRRLAKNGYDGKVWITEVGYPTGGWYPTRVAEKKYGAYIVKTMTLLAVRGVRVACWYQLFDPPRDRRKKRNSEDYFGLAYPDFEKKQGAEAYPACVKNIVGKTYNPASPISAALPKSVESYCFEGDDGLRTLILWKRHSGTKTVTLPLAGSEHKVFDSKTGLSSTFEPSQPVEISAFPLIITWKE